MSLVEGSGLRWRGAVAGARFDCLSTATLVNTNQITFP